MGQETVNIAEYKICLSVNSPTVRTPTFSHNNFLGIPHYLRLFPPQCPHFPYISLSEPNSLSVNVHRWPQNEDPTDPAIHCNSWPSATCR